MVAGSAAPGQRSCAAPQACKPRRGAGCRPCCPHQLVIGALLCQPPLSNDDHMVRRRQVLLLVSHQDARGLRERERERARSVSSATGTQERGARPAKGRVGVRPKQRAMHSGGQCSRMQNTRGASCRHAGRRNAGHRGAHFTPGPAGRRCSGRTGGAPRARPPQTAGRQAGTHLREAWVGQVGVHTTGLETTGRLQRELCRLPGAGRRQEGHATGRSKPTAQRRHLVRCPRPPPSPPHLHLRSRHGPARRGDAARRSG